MIQDFAALLAIALFVTAVAVIAMGIAVAPTPV